MCDNLRIGIIGGGAMAEAIIAGVTSSGAVAAPHIFVSEHKAVRCDMLAHTYGVHAEVGAEHFLSRIDMLILAVKPAAAAAAVRETAEHLRVGACVLSIVAGLKIAVLEEAYLGHPVVRAMPNTPLAAGAGMSAYACGSLAGDRARELTALILGAAGRTTEVHEADMDAVTGLSGSGPAYAFLMMEALIEGGVAAGLRRDTATLLTAQTVLGAAEMVLRGKMSPADLRAAVTSPAGTTAAGLRELECGSVRAAFMEAVLAAAQRARELGRN